MHTGTSRILNPASLTPALLSLTMAVNIPHDSRAASATFTPIGNLDASANPAGSFATGVSADGKVVVGSSFFFDGASTQTRAVEWTPGGGMRNLGLPPFGLAASSANRVSNDGSVVVGAVGFVIGGELEIRNGLAIRVDDLKSKGMLLPSALTANDVTADGSIIVGATRVPAPLPVFDRAFYKNAKTAELHELGVLPGGSYSSASAVSADGSVIAGYGDTPAAISAARWTRLTGFTELAGQPPGNPSQANGISSDGRYIVGSLNDEAFRWSERSRFLLLGKLPGAGFSVALDVSADGLTVVGYNYFDDGQVAFIWDRKHGMRQLQDLLTDDFGIDLTGWTLNSATGVSDNGRTIVGFGIDPAGGLQGWVIRMTG